MPTLDSRTEQGIVRPSRQVVLGLVLLLAGTAFAAATIKAGIDVVPGIGIVLAVLGLVILGNAAKERMVGHAPGTEQKSGGADTQALVALALAVVLPPLGVLLAAGTPSTQRRGSALGGLAIAVGAILTVAYTLILVMALGDARAGSGN